MHSVDNANKNLVKHNCNCLKKFFLKQGFVCERAFGMFIVRNAKLMDATWRHSKLKYGAPPGQNPPTHNLPPLGMGPPTYSPCPNPRKVTKKVFKVFFANPANLRHTPK